MNGSTRVSAIAQSEHRSIWSALLLILLLTLPPLLIEVHKPSPTRIMETLSFLSSQETWLRMHQGYPGAWKMPTWNGQPRIQKPPLLVWLHLLVWKGLTPKSAPVETLVSRARWLGAGMSMLAVLAIFAAAYAISDRQTALVAALATGLSLGFIRQARYASYDTHLMGWATLAVVSAIIACQSSRAANAKKRLAWALAFLALTAANYTKGPLGFALVLPPWFAAIAFFSEQPRRDALAAFIALLLGLLTLLPWFTAAHSALPNAGALLRDEYAYVFEIAKNPFFYLVIIALVFPWTLWLMAGILLPAWHRGPERPRHALFAWTWFVIVFILLSLSPVKNKRYLAPLFPAGGLLVAFVWSEGMKASGRLGTWHRRVHGLHWLVLILATVLLPVFAWAEPRLLAAGWVSQATLGQEGWIVWKLAPILLVPLCGLGLWAHRKNSFFISAMATAAWFSVAATCGFYAYARLPRQQYAYRSDAERLAQWGRQTPIYYISRFRPPYHEAAPGHELLIYFRGIIPQASFDDLLARAEAGEAFLALTRLLAQEELRLERAGFLFLDTISDGRTPDWKLYASPRFNRDIAVHLLLNQ